MIQSLIRPNLIKFQAYSSARHLYQEGLFFDANENPFGSVVKSLFGLELNRYPDPFARKLKERLSEYVGVKPEALFTGVGSDEVIDLLIRLFVSEDEEVIIFEPTYGMYRAAAEIAGVKIKTALLTSDFQIDFSVFKKQLTSKTKMVFCCSPNNPTGNLLEEEAILKLCKSFKGIVVVDEAYIEFASRPSLTAKLKKFENLVLLRTFSKAWGLAGIRVGYAVALPLIVEYLNKIKPPYNLNSVSASIAEQALGKTAQVSRWIKVILREREKLGNVLEELGYEAFESEANFILAKRRDASHLVKELARRFGIITRDMSSKPHLEDCFRISVGTPRQNQKLKSALRKIG